MGSSIRFWDRYTNRLETEQVFGESLIRFIYEHPFGSRLGAAVSARAWPSQIYGAYQSSPLSRRAIPRFIERFHIDMNEYEPGPFLSFNDFFCRAFRENARPFASAPDAFPAFAEARYLAFESINAMTTFPIKGMTLSLPALLFSAPRAKDFEGGPVFIARLCPTDYHRFHFPDAGHVLEQVQAPGRLDSVSPIALQSIGDILVQNERQIAFVETQHFGTIAYIEVGALCVGKIVQSYRGDRVERGDEKGYFLFGGSTVVVVGQPGGFVPDADLLDKTREGFETFVRLGDRIASRGASLA